MKKMMFFLMALVLVVFTSRNSFAQDNKTQRCITLDDMDYFACADEVLVGTVEMCETFWDGKYQFMVKGTYVGEDSGLNYSYSLVQNRIWKPSIEGQGHVFTEVGTASVECEGVPIAVAKARDILLSMPMGLLSWINGN